MLLTTIAAIGLSATAAQASNGPFVTGTLLRDLCSSEDQEFQTVCVVYIRGLLEGSIYGQPFDESPTRYSLFMGCPGDDTSVSYVTARRIVARYLEENPEMESQLGMIVVSRAMNDAFPCDE